MPVSYKTELKEGDMVKVDDVFIEAIKTTKGRVTITIDAPKEKKITKYTAGAKHAGLHGK